jgi:hypothetical protein
MVYIVKISSKHGFDRTVTVFACNLDGANMEALAHLQEGEFVTSIQEE